MMNDVVICNSADNIRIIQSKWITWSRQVEHPCWILTRELQRKRTLGRPRPR